MNESSTRTLTRAIFLLAITTPIPPDARADEESVASRGREGCQLIKIAEWAVWPGARQPVVEGRINGKLVGMILDTGSPRTVVTRSIPIRLGLRREATRQRVYGIDGPTTAETTVADVDVGDTPRKDWPMLVVGDQDFGAIGIILGGDYLRHADIEFDLAHDAVRLFHAMNCKGVSLAYWAPEGAGQVAIDSPDSDPKITFKVEVNGHALDGQLDSGAERSILSQWTAGVLGGKRDSAGIVAAGCIMGLGRKPTQVWYGPPDTFAIGDERIRNPTISFADIWKYFHSYNYRPDMLLGADFLRAHRVLVARSQRKMYFTYAGGTVFPSGRAGACPDSAASEPGSKPAASAN